MPRGYNAQGELVGTAKEMVEGRFQPANPGGAYSDEVKIEVLELLADGHTPAMIEKRPGMPTQRMIRYWAQFDPEFSEAYYRARSEGATALVYGAVDCADEAYDKDTAQAARVKSETRIKVAGLLDPQRYGRQAQGGAIAIQINTNVGGGGQTAQPDGAYVVQIDAESVQNPCSDDEQGDK